MKKLNILILATLQLFLIASCSKEESSIDEVEEVEVDDSVFEIPDWTTETHSKKADPNFEEVFADNPFEEVKNGIFKI